MRVCAVRAAVRVGRKTGFEESAGHWAADSLGWEWDESILPRKPLRVASVGLVAVLVPLLLRQTYFAIPKLTEEHVACMYMYVTHMKHVCDRYVTRMWHVCRDMMSEKGAIAIPCLTGFEMSMPQQCLGGFCLGRWTWAKSIQSIDWKQKTFYVMKLLYMLWWTLLNHHMIIYSIYITICDIYTICTVYGI